MPQWEIHKYALQRAFLCEEIHRVRQLSHIGRIKEKHRRIPVLFFLCLFSLMRVEKNEKKDIDFFRDVVYLAIVFGDERHHVHVTIIKG